MRNLFVLIFCALLSGCTGGVLFAAGFGGYFIPKYKDFSTSKSDRDLQKTVKLEYSDIVYNDGTIVADIEIIVDDEKIYLVGDTEDALSKSKIITKLASLFKNQIIDEVTVKRRESTLYDNIITAQIKLILVTSRGILSSNYIIKTISGEVIIIGKARNRDEIFRITHKISKIFGVKKVINYIMVAD